jgi:CheY-like chemotaxis protein
VYADDLVQSMLDLLRRTLGETIEVQLVRNFDLWQCEIDPGQLENLILNLAINARDAMPKGGRLTIETSNSMSEDEEGEAPRQEYVLLTVRDTGSGMSANVVEHAFDPFFTTKDVGQGSGLGLSMVYGFVKQSGGFVKIDSAENRGTTLEVYFPRHTGSPPRRVAAEEPTSPPHARNETILVVEDDPDLRVLIVQMLKSLGYGVEEASSGAMALNLLESSPRIDLMVTDVVLPGGMSARGLVKEVERLSPKLPVIYMSGYATDTITDHGHLDRDTQFLQKPFRILKMARAVRNALRARGS